MQLRKRRWRRIPEREPFVAIIEEFMLDIMYEIPKDDSIGQVTITQEYIENTGGPIITLRGQEVPRLESQA